MVEVYRTLQLCPESLQACVALSRIPALVDSPYVLTQMAIAHHHLQDVDAVVDSFRAVRKADPYRLDHLDVLSNSLFVKGTRAELADLAHHCSGVSKYCPETCLVVGNYYSLRGEHDKAVVNFQRALNLDPRKSDAWTLLGHEFMELKNAAAATMSYRKALEIDPRDCRAWYGLGQHYDILKMPNYAMYYYNMGQKVHPQDSRMIIALGEMYQKQGKYDEARTCYWKAHLVGDLEGQAVLKLGKLYEKMKNGEQAAAVYAMSLQQAEQTGLPEGDHKPHCYRFLADYHTNKRNFDDAHYYAQLCLEHDSELYEFVEKFAEAAPVGDVSPPVPVGDVSPPVPVGDVSPPVPIGDVSPPVPVGDVSPPVPVGDVSPPVPVGDVAASAIQCWNCYNFGHEKRNCPTLRLGPRCSKCWKYGHRQRDCQNPPLCNRCWGIGHYSYNCPGL